MPATTVAAASTRYGDFYVPRYEIIAGGSSLDAGVLRDVKQVTYNDSITEIDSFDLTVNNWDPVARRFKYVGAETTVEGGSALERLFNPCVTDFELKLGYGAELTTIVRGAATSLEPQFPAGGAPTLTVRALNALFKLRRKQYRDHWTNKRISEVAEDIGRRNDPGGGKRFPMLIRVDANARRSEPQLDYIAQNNQYDIDFLLLEARKIGYVVYIDIERTGRTSREVLRFGPSTALNPGVPSVAYELEWGISLIDFAPKLATANQVKSVEVRSVDRETNRSIREKADLHSDGLDVNKDLLPLLEPRGCEPREEVIVKEPQYTTTQAKRRALAVLSERLKQLVEATGTTVGLPDLRSGQRVRILGLGKRFSGKYFVIKTTHTLNDSGYTTKFTARREAAD